MKRCPKCRRDYYDETLLYCLDDGVQLLDGPASGAEHPTAIIGTGPSNLTGTLSETRLFNERSSISAHFRRHKLAGIAAVLGAAVILSGFGYGVYQFVRGGRNEPAPVRARDIQTQRLTGDGRTRMPVISPDGKFLVYVKLDQGQESLWIKQVVSGSAVVVVKPGEGANFFGITFTPDGNFVYFNANMGGSERPTVYRVPTLGGTPVKFLSDAIYVQFSPDGKLISFRRPYPLEVNESIVIANADGSNGREIVSRAGKQFFGSAGAWAPDGTVLAVSIGDDALGGSNNMSMAIVGVADGSIREFGSRRWDVIDDVVWHPSGDSLIATASENLFLTGQLWEIAYPSGEARRLTNNLHGHYGVSLTADGRAIVTGERYSRSAIWVSPDLKPENAKQVMPATGDTWGLSWTPDGRIVYVSDQSGDAEVWIMNSDGTEARPLTSDRVFKTLPVVSPDGKYIVYISSQNGGQIVRIDIGGGNPLVLTKALGADNAHISPDGRWVIYSAFVDGLPKIVRVAIEGGEERVVTESLATEPRYSNDGSRFACFMLDEKTAQWTKLAIVPTDGGPPVAEFPAPPETNSSRGPVWTPDDKSITVVVDSGEKQNLWIQPADGGPARQMTNFDSPGIARREFSRDGKRIAIVRAEGVGNAIMITDYR